MKHASVLVVVSFFFPVVVRCCGRPILDVNNTFIGVRAQAGDHARGLTPTVGQLKDVLDPVNDAQGTTWQQLSDVSRVEEAVRIYMNAHIRRK
jgi:hypothetical protein